MRRIVTLTCLVLAGSSLYANEDYLAAFEKKYFTGEDHALAKKECALCHKSNDDFEMNPFGAAIKAKGTGPVDATFASVESLDSDGDGTPNGEEISADKAPGDSAEGGKAGVAATPPAESEKENPLLPKSAHHPAIVHFPIGLFIAGLILDFLGMVRKDKTLLQAGWYNILLASLTSLAAIATGIGAMTLMKFPLKGNVLQHLIFTIVATALMLIMVSIRFDRHEKMNVPMRVLYYVLAAAGFFIMSWAGHLGGIIAGTA